MSEPVCQIARCVIHLGTFERRARASGISDAEGVLGEGVQNSTGIVEEFEGLVTGVDDGRGNLQVLQSIDFDTGGRSLDRQTRGGGDGDCRGDESDEGSAEGRGEHCDEGIEGGRGDDSDETFGLNEPGLNTLSVLTPMCQVKPGDNIHATKLDGHREDTRASPLANVRSR